MAFVTEGTSGIGFATARAFAGAGARVVVAARGEQAGQAACAQLELESASQHPMARMASEEEVAHATLWLCSESSGFVTGSPLHVDGGYLAA